MKSFHLSGPKFDIAAEMFRVGEFSMRSEIRRTNTPVSHIILNGSIHK